MLVGYARTSTVEQEAGLEAQVRDLNALGCDRIFSEHVSSVSKRERLEEAIRFVREGDTVVVTRLDRLARSVGHLLSIVQELEGKGVGIRILDMGLDTITPTGRLILNVVASIAQFEREVMLERQREGIAKAKKEGRYRGRIPTARQKATEVLHFKNSGMKPQEIARRLGISRASVYRIISENQPESF
jgi:DNA invertase Pin-like site-specific DNA recombinase